MGYEEVEVSHRMESDVAIWLRGAPSAFQSGMSSSSARVSMTAPETMCEPAEGNDSDGREMVSHCC
jgi:hypothetical protein